ncbi:hypothetical protein DOY81_006843, partial [Sarcophaga bullata]
LDAVDDIPLSILSRLAKQKLECVEFTTIDENLLTESDIEISVEEINLSSSENGINTVKEHPNKISSFKKALEEVRKCKIAMSPSLQRDERKKKFTKDWDEGEVLILISFVETEKCLGYFGRKVTVGNIHLPSDVESIYHFSFLVLASSKISKEAAPQLNINNASSSSISNFC